MSMRRGWWSPPSSVPSLPAAALTVRYPRLTASQTFRQLYTYSVTPQTRSEFWSHVFRFSNFIHSGSYTRVVDESAPIDAVPRWFEGVHLNFAENVLYSRGSSSDPASRSTLHKDDAKIAITEIREGGGEVRHVAWRELRARAAALAAAMYHGKGVRRGDRVVIVAANSVETFLVWLATNWLGAVFSSSSTDMGVKGILQRSVQVNPKVGSIRPERRMGRGLLMANMPSAADFCGRRRRLQRKDRRPPPEDD